MPEVLLEVPAPLGEIAVASTDGAVLRVRRHGNAAAATRLFVSHGNGFAIDGYFAFWRRFLGDFEVVAFDMRSHGRNPRADPGHHDYAHMVDDVDVIARAVQGEWAAKPSAGVFHSMSAQSALLQAMRGAPGFDALILFDPPNMPPSGHPVYDAMLVYERKLNDWAGNRRDRFATPERLAMEYALTRSGQRWPAGTALAMARAVLQQDGDGWALACPRELEASMYLQGVTLDLWPRCADVSVPVTLIGADPDCPFPAATGLANRALAQEGGFDYLAVPGTSHLLQLEEPAACADAVLGVLCRLGFSG